MSFECAAEANEAADGFSGVMGKNDWYYLAWDGATYSKLEFNPVANVWQKGGKLAVSADALMPDEGRYAVRQWLAPHDGTIRVEGSVMAGSGKSDGIKTEIIHNATVVWPTDITQPGKFSVHDLHLKVKKGDMVSFRAGQNGSVSTDDRILWNPVITYVIELHK